MSVEDQPKYSESWFVETWINVTGNTSYVFRDFRLLAIAKLKHEEACEKHAGLSATEDITLEIMLEANKQLAIARSRLVASDKHVTRYRTSDDDYAIIYEHLEEDFGRLVDWMRKSKPDSDPLIEAVMVIDNMFNPKD